VATVIAVEWGVLRNEISSTSSRVAGLLREFSDGSVVLPGSTWSVGEVGAHLVTIPRRYLDMLARPIPFPESLSAMNDAEIAALGIRDPDQLAGLLESDTAELLRVLGYAGDRVVAFFGMNHTVEGVGGVMLGELLLHGLDLARLTKRPWPIRADQAQAVMSGLLPSVVYSVDREVARRSTGTYHLHLRGGDDWTIRVEDSDVTIERRRPQRADLHVSQEPVAALLVGYGRMSRWRALLSGRIVAWGRKPWLAVRFANLFAET